MKTDTYMTDDPICPNCGKIIYDWYDLNFNHNNDTVEITCEGCEKDFKITIYVSTRFVTKNTEEEENNE